MVLCCEPARFRFDWTDDFHEILRFVPGRPDPTFNTSRSSPLDMEIISTSLQKSGKGYLWNKLTKLKQKSDPNMGH